MGDIAYYEGKITAEIDIKGNDSIDVKNFISIYYNLDRNYDKTIIDQVLDKINLIGIEHIKEIFFKNRNEYLSDYLESNNITTENISEFLNENIYEAYYNKFDSIVIESNILHDVDKNILDRLKELNIKFDIINGKAIVNLAEVWKSIYCENDNSSSCKVDENLLNTLFSNFPDKLQLSLKVDGSGTNC